MCSASAKAAAAAETVVVAATQTVAVALAAVARGFSFSFSLSLSSSSGVSRSGGGSVGLQLPPPPHIRGVPCTRPWLFTSTNSPRRGLTDGKRHGMQQLVVPSCEVGLNFGLLLFISYGLPQNGLIVISADPTRGLISDIASGRWVGQVGLAAASVTSVALLCRHGVKVPGRVPQQCSAHRHFGVGRARASPASFSPGAVPRTR